MRRLSAAFAGLTLLLAAGGAAGEQPTRALEQTIVVEDGGQCIEHQALTDAVAEWLRTHQVDARLTVLVKRQREPRPTVSFWVWRAGAPIAERHLPARAGSCEDVLSALALAVALAIDATILDAPPEPAPKRPPPPKPRPTPEPAPAPPATSWGVWWGPSWISSSVDVGPWLGVNAGGFVRPLWPLAAEVDVALTLSGGSVDLPGGRARSQLGWLRLAVLVEPWPDAPISPALGLGGGPLLAWADADPSPGSTAADDQTTVALLFARGRLSFELSRHLDVSLTLNVGQSTPELVLRADREAAATLASPLVEGVLAAGYTWH